MAFGFSVVLSDPSNLGGAADAGLVTDLQAALADWSQYITGLGTLVVQLNIETTATGRADAASTSVLTDGTLPGGITLVGLSSVHELLTGTHNGADTSDITVEVDPAYIPGLFLDPAPGSGTVIPGNETDAVSVFRHELGHSFGQIGYYAQDGTLEFSGQFETKFDTFIVREPDGSAFFTGPTAEQVFGGPLPLTTDSTTENYYHFGNARNDPLGQDLMNGVEFDFGTRYDISDVDLAVLKDSGVPVIGGVSGPLPCFRAGTRILTPRGEIAIETLRPGDTVLTLAGFAPVVWIGRTRIDAARHPQPAAVTPFRIAAHAFAPGLPHSDLCLSPDHAVLVDGALVPVHRLANGASIAQVAAGQVAAGLVIWLHLELDRHAVLLAEGLPAESYLDTGNRSAFDPWNSGSRPQVTQAPSVRSWECV